MGLWAGWALLAGLCLGQPGWAQVMPGPWIQRNPPSAISNPAGITYGNGQFVIVGGNGGIVTSPDGLTWTPRSSGITNGLSAVGFGNGQFVAVGGTTILTSSNGVAWTGQASGMTDGVNAVGYGSGHWVVVGAAGTILTSTDGVAWTAQASGSTNGLYGVVFGSGQFVAVGDSGTILSSMDTVHWVQEFQNTVNMNLRCVTYGDGRFVAAAVGPDPAFSQGLILTSPDGIHWTVLSTNDGTWLPALAYGGGEFVAVGESWVSMTVVTSADGLNWTVHPRKIDTTLLAVAYGGGVFIAVDLAGVVYKSPDGINWNPHDLFGAAYGNGQYVVVGDNGSILSSLDAVTWTPRDAGTTNRLLAVAGNASGFALVTGGPAILGSPDGVTWTPRNTGTTNGLYGIAAGNGLFVAIGQRGTIAHSLDGTNWYSSAFAANLQWIAITCGNNGFFAIGNVYDAAGPHGATLTSSVDGGLVITPWAPVTWPTDAVLAAGSGVIVLATATSTWTSTNGVDWTTNYSGFYLDQPSTIGYGAGQFIVPALVFAPRCFPCPSYWGVFSSPDGVNWGGWGFDQRGPLYGIGYGGGRFIAVGAAGAVWEFAVTPELGTLRPLSGGGMRGSISWVAAASCALDVSTNLTDWTRLTNVATTNGTAQFSDPAGTNFSR
ncbi:MAG: hypothetical protein KGS61_01570, partial [Verrucomicrobia bacterium]|nr:hypothetical protein [Verrucomicrobiota bacterium]